MAKPDIQVKVVPGGGAPLVQIVIAEDPGAMRTVIPLPELRSAKDLRRLARKLKRAANIIEVGDPETTVAAKAVRR